MTAATGRRRIKVGDITRGPTPSGPPLDRYWRGAIFRVDAVDGETWTMRTALKVCSHRHRYPDHARACAGLLKFPEEG